MLEETVLGKTHYCIYCKDIKEPFIIGKCPPGGSVGEHSLWSRCQEWVFFPQTAF